MKVSYRPITFTSNHNKNIEIPEEDSEQEENIPPSSQRKRALRHGFYTGAIVGMIMGGGIVDCYHSNQSEAMLKNLKEELESSRDVYHQIKVDTLNNGTPVFILVDQKGNKNAYDPVSHRIFHQYGSTVEEDFNW